MDEEVKIPDEFVSKNKPSYLVMDIVSINKQVLPTIINMSIIFKTCVTLASRLDQDIFTGLDVILHHYSNTDHTIIKIHVDETSKS